MRRFLKVFIGFLLSLCFVGAVSAADGADCSSADSLCSSAFTIQLDDFGLAGDLIGGTAKETANNVIARIIQSMMILIGVIALLIMTVGAGYMIIYHGDEELLSRGKGIFTAGISALVISLSAYYIVDLVGYLLYR